LTSLVYSESISTTLATRPKYVDLLLGLLEDEEAGVRHRGYEVWRGMGEVIALSENVEEKETAVAALRTKGVVTLLEGAKAREEVVELRESIEGAIRSISAVQAKT
jgi:hypothetical protein